MAYRQRQKRGRSECLAAGPVYLTKKPRAQEDKRGAIDLERHHDAAALNTMPERFHAFASRRMTSL